MPELQQIALFDDDLPKDTSPLDDTQIVQTILYHSIDESREFRKLCKQGMKHFYPTNYQERGNISDFLLHLLRNNFKQPDEPHTTTNSTT